MPYARASYSRRRPGTTVSTPATRARWLRRWKRWDILSCTSVIWRGSRHRRHARAAGEDYRAYTYVLVGTAGVELRATSPSPVPNVLRSPVSSCKARRNGEALMLEGPTFVLAVIGYAGLTTTAILASVGRLPVWLWRATVVVILAHVILVWTVRYDWQLAEATRNGYVGFLLFHSALAMILASLVVPGRVARGLVWAAFAVVTPGALGAVFRYDVVASYRIPVILIAAVGIVGLAHGYRSSQKRPARLSGHE